MVGTKSRGYSNSGRLSEGEYSVPFFVGMGRYEKYVHREVANAKPYRFRDSAF